MKITNKAGLPDAFVRAAEKGQYKKGKNYSASMLFSPIQKVLLERRHWDELEQDVSDMIWLLMGRAIHSVLETGAGDNDLSEEYLAVDMPNGTRISGVPDLFSDGVIYDYKFTSVWSYVFLKDKIDDFSGQLNTYRFLLERYGFPVTALKIVMVFKDWKKRDCHKDGYPQCQVEQINIPFADIESRAIEYIDKAESFAGCDDDALPECSLDDRWGTAPKFAVMAKGRKTAKRVLDTHEAAENWMIENGGDFIEDRPGDEWKRCEEYCTARPFCAQYRKAHEKA